MVGMLCIYLLHRLEQCSIDAMEECSLYVIPDLMAFFVTSECIAYVMFDQTTNII